MKSRHIFSNLLAAVALSGCLMPLKSLAIMPSEAVFHNEATDTVRINNLLIEAVKIKDPQERVAFIGKQFIDTPYVGGTLEGDKEELRVNIDELDCTTFIDNVLAIAYTAGEGRSSWRDFIYNLENMRYRAGEMNGYSSRLHYFSDWVVDNVHRGNVKEYTSHIPGCSWEIKTIDFMTQNRDKYPALQDSLEYERMKNAEIGYRSHRFPYIKSSRINKVINGELKEGDVVALTTKIPGLDVTHMGIIIKRDGIPHLLHASSKKGKVIIDDLSLTDYLKKNGGTGFRVIRLAE